MRQIKFRGKRLDNGEWVYGDLLHIAGGCLIYFGSDGETSAPDIEKSNLIAVEFFKDEIAVVVPDTVGQFTGMFDKNGKEVYEGDIVIARSEGECRICEVVYSEHTCGFFLYHNSGPWYMSTDDTMKDTSLEIISNVHDNPELLKGGTK